MSVLITSNRVPIQLGAELGKGGEGIVYAVADNTQWVAKVYHATHRTPEREKKLRAMIDNPPNDDTRAQNPPHISIAWPVELLYERKRFAGFLMPRIAKSPDLFEIYNPVMRAKTDPNFDWRHLHRAAKNLAIALHALHSRGYVMGDVNQKNILVTSDAMITMVDTDSFQVPGGNGRMFRCTVGVPDYTPAELQKVQLDQVDRAAHHDLFGLGVLIFQMLMEGFHPFTGAPKDPSLSLGGEIFLHCINAGIFPYQENAQVAPPPGAPSYFALHTAVREKFMRCFVIGHIKPASRPSALEWVYALEEAEKTLAMCPKNQLHWNLASLDACQWCEREARALKARQAQRKVAELAVQTPPPERAALAVRMPRPLAPMHANKSPSLAAFLSLVFPGCGHFYLGLMSRASIDFCVSLVPFVICCNAPFSLDTFLSSLCFLSVTRIFASMDAYSTGEKIRRGESV